ncbi:MAG TPA: DUF2079 domain-containing protein, partial [Planctomycetota bacterium]|nr:DUF2079 domain-containing protein [Planctomycetota bacterium]
MSKRRRRRETGETRPTAPRDDVRVARGFFDRHGTLVVWVLMGVYALVFSAMSLVKYSWFLYNDFDLAIFSQAAWTTMRGSMHSSILGLNYLGSHMSLTMLLISPVYTVLPSPVTLLVIQSVVLSLGALPVYRLARRELKNGFVAVSFAALYLMYPALGYTNLYEFHPVTLATTTLLYTFYYLWVGRFGLMVLFAMLSLMAKENVGAVVFMMGLYALALKRPRRRLCATTLVALSAAFLVVSMGVVMPALNKGQVEYASFYQDWGDSMGEAVTNMATSPLKVLKAFFWTTYDGPNPAVRDYSVTVKHQYWVHLLVPL